MVAPNRMPDSRTAAAKACQSVRMHACRILALSALSYEYLQEYLSKMFFGRGILVSAAIAVGSSAGSRPGGTEVYFSQNPGQAKGWERLILNTSTCPSSGLVRHRKRPCRDCLVRNTLDFISLFILVIYYMLHYIRWQARMLRHDSDT
jgi:hypothetical protein